MGILAAIDIGSHTARLLIAKEGDGARLFRPILRKRHYIHLAEGFDDKEGRLSAKAVERTLRVLDDFRAIIKTHNANNSLAVCTGVLRSATHPGEFLRLVREKTGITARVISGEEESLLTAKGVKHSLGLEKGEAILFDLGGWSTEFFWEDGPEESKSILLGAVSLKETFLKADPPKDEEIGTLRNHVGVVLGKCLGNSLPVTNKKLLVGTGGTVTTIGAMIHGVSPEDIDPNRMNGLKLKREKIKCLFDEIRPLPFEERLKIPVLDHERADVIVAGTAAVLGIVDHLGFGEMTVSLSDILEGLIICQLEGGRNGQQGGRNKKRVYLR